MNKKIIYSVLTLYCSFAFSKPIESEKIGQDVPILSENLKNDVNPVVKDDTEMVNQDGKVLVGYWHNWANGRGYQGGNSPAIELKNVPTDYNVIDVSFMKVYDVGAGRIPTFHLDPSTGLTEATFKEQIKQLNVEGRSVLIALGGADAHVELQTGDEQPFANEIIRLVETYGFDGLDIDLEQAAITAGDNQAVIPEALKIVKDHYREEGKNFMITMAPEFPYLHPGKPYEPYITKLDGYYDFINPQFYNQGGDGLWVDELNMWLTQNNDEMKEDFIYYMIDSFDKGTRSYIHIPSEKMVFGIPSSIDAAATGYVIDPQDLFNAFNRLESEGRNVKGIMTWSINWDMGTNSSGVPYDESFVNAYGPFLFGEGPIVINNPPKILGADTVTINKGDSFNPLEGVTATDLEDGDLTSEIVVTGSVDTEVVGSYNLLYKVSDSEGKTTEVTRAVTVVADTPSAIIDFITPKNNERIKLELGESIAIELNVVDPDEILNDVKISVDNQTFDGDIAEWIPSKFGEFIITATGKGDDTLVITEIKVNVVEKSSGNCADMEQWDTNKIYNTPGTQVVYEGSIYENKWYIAGEIPSESSAWEFIDYCDGNTPDLDKTCGYERWLPKAYDIANTFVYNNEAIYKNKWYVEGNQEPGVDSVWEFVEYCHPDQSVKSFASESSSIKAYLSSDSYNLSIKSDKKIMKGAIYSSYGKEVKRFNSSSISIVTLQKGTYFLKVILEDGSVGKTKFIKGR